MVLETPGDYREDNVAVVLKHANGARSSIDYLANGDPACPKEHIEVFAGRGLAACEDFWRTSFSRGGRVKKHKTSGMDKGFQAELEAFRDAILGKRPPPIPFESLANTTLTCFRIQESIATGEARRV